MVMKNPGFTAVGVLTLAMAIGANVVVFSVLNALILHPLHVPQAKSLYGLQQETKLPRISPIPTISICGIATAGLTDLAAYDAAQVGLDTGENRSRVRIVLVSGNYFDVLHLQPSLGRFSHASDEHGPNSAHYIVPSYAFWHTHFQDDLLRAGSLGPQQSP